MVGAHRFDFSWYGTNFSLFDLVKMVSFVLNPKYDDSTPIMGNLSGENLSSILSTLFGLLALSSAKILLEVDLWVKRRRLLVNHRPFDLHSSPSYGNI